MSLVMTLLDKRATRDCILVDDLEGNYSYTPLLQWTEKYYFLSTISAVALFLLLSMNRKLPTQKKTHSLFTPCLRPRWAVPLSGNAEFAA